MELKTAENNFSYFNDQEFLGLMRSFEKEYKYDITYFTGFLSSWEFNKDDLGEQEKAIVELSTRWSRMGLMVQVYGLFPSLEHLDGYREYQGVHYYHVNKFNFGSNYKRLIVTFTKEKDLFIQKDLKISNCKKSADPTSWGELAINFLKPLDFSPFICYDMDDMIKRKVIP